MTLGHDNAVSAIEASAMNFQIEIIRHVADLGVRRTALAGLDAVRAAAIEGTVAPDTRPAARRFNG